jgi:hypothetical protein
VTGDRTITQGTLALTGADADNYVLSWNNGSGTINKAPLTVRANDDAKFVTLTDAVGYNGVNYTGFVNGETNTVLGGAVAIARTNSGSNAAGTYSGVLLPSGLTAANYDINFATGNYTIVPANQLLVRVANTSAVYGSAPVFTITSAEYWNGSSVIATLPGGGMGNTFTYTDGVGGGVTLTLGPSGVVNSTGGKTVVGNYTVNDAAPIITGSNFTSLNFVGNLAVTPKSVAVSANGVTKVYDGNTAMSGATLGLIGKETGDLLTVTGTGAFAGKNAGTSLNYTISSLVLGGSDVANYFLTGGTSLAGSNGAITPKALSVSGVTASNKVYDSNTSAAVVTTGAVYGGLVAGDALSVAATGTFDTKHAGTGKTVTLASTYSGADVGNYSITDQASTPANITPFALTVSAAGVNKVYDATTTATVNLSDNRFAGDMLTAAGSATFSDKNVATGKTVTATGLALAGADAANYTVNTTATTTADITALGITGSITAANKTYDATTAATITGRTLSGVLGTDAVSYTGGSATFSDKNVATSKTVMAAGLALAGADAANYTVNTTATTTADITPASLAVTANNAAKTYGQTTSFTGTEFGSSGLQNSETIGTVTFTSAGAVPTANVAGSPYAIVPSSVTGGTFNAGNYTITYNNGALTVNPAALTLSAVTDTKTYDATTSSTASPTSSGLVGGDTVSSLSQVFDSKNAGARTLSVSGGYVVNDGNRGANYSVTTTTAAGTIIPAALTISAATNTKTYDATTSAVATPTVLGLQTGDTVTGLAEAYAEKNAGTGKTLLVSGYTVNDGNSGNNYTVVSNTAAGTIDKATLTIAADDKTRPVSTPNPPLTATYSGFVAAEGPTDLGSAMVLSTPAVLTSPAGVYSIVVGGHVAMNYVITYVDGVLRVISGAGVTTPDSDAAYQAALAVNSQPDRSGLGKSAAGMGAIGTQGAQVRNQQVYEVESTGIRLPAGLAGR